MRAMTLMVPFSRSVRGLPSLVAYPSRILRTMKPTTQLTIIPTILRLPKSRSQPTPECWAEHGITVAKPVLDRDNGGSFKS